MTRRVTTTDGWTLSVQVHEATGAARGVVLLLHAMMVDGRTLDRPRGAGLASTLASAGFEVWRPDLRGRGASGPTPAQGASWTYDDLVRGDLPALLGAARERGLPVAIVGHSLGGHVAVAAAVEGAPPDAFVLLAVNVWRPSHEPSRRRRLRKEVAMRAFLGVARSLGRFPAAALGIGTCDESAAYVADLVRFWREDRFGPREPHPGRSGGGVREGDWEAGMAAVRVPVLAVAGAGDRWFASPAGVRAFADGFGPGRVDTWVERRGHRDCPWDPDHMGLACDVRSKVVWVRIAEWLQKNLRCSPAIHETHPPDRAGRGGG